jgi:hypothetical protein
MTKPKSNKAAPMTNRKLLAALREAHRHWHAAALHRKVAWAFPDLMDHVWDQLTRDEATKLRATWRTMYREKDPRKSMFAIPRIIALYIKALERVMKRATR